MIFIFILSVTLSHVYSIRCRGFGREEALSAWSSVIDALMSIFYVSTMPRFLRFQFVLRRRYVYSCLWYRHCCAQRRSACDSCLVHRDYFIRLLNSLSSGLSFPCYYLHHHHHHDSYITAKFTTIIALILSPPPEIFTLALLALLRSWVLLFSLSSVAYFLVFSFSFSLLLPSHPPSLSLSVSLCFFLLPSWWRILSPRLCF